MQTLLLPHSVNSWENTQNYLKSALDNCQTLSVSGGSSSAAAEDAHHVQCEPDGQKSLGLRLKKRKVDTSISVNELFDNLQNACETIHGELCPKNIFSGEFG